MTNQPAFKVGDLVERSSPDAGYRFPGEVIGLGESKPGRTLYMVKTMVPGCENMVHVFGEKNLQPWDGVSQPSPVLTAEERKVIEGIDAVYLNELQWPGGPEDPEQIRAIMHIHDTLKGLLSRTADPDTVTLPREVALDLFWMAQDCRAPSNNPTRSLEVAEQALANTQSQGGDDE